MAYASAVPALHTVEDPHQLALACLHWARALPCVLGTPRRTANSWSDLLEREGLKPKVTEQIAHRAACVLGLQETALAAVAGAAKLSERFVAQAYAEPERPEPRLHLSALRNHRGTLELLAYRSREKETALQSQAALTDPRRPPVRGFALMRILQKDYLNEPTLDEEDWIRFAQYLQKDAVLSAFEAPAKVLAATCDVVIDMWPCYPEGTSSRMLLQSAEDRARTLLQHKLDELERPLEAARADLATRLARTGVDSLQEVHEAMREAPHRQLTPARVLWLRKDRRITMAQVEGVLDSAARLQAVESSIVLLGNARQLLSRLYESTRVELTH